MKKQMLLTIFKHQDKYYPRGYVVPTLMVSGGTLDVTTPTINVDKMSQRKRLTDTELAAEAYRQNIRAIGECGEAAISHNEAGEYRVVPLDVMVFGPMRREVWQSHTVIRFATLPHYDE